MLVKKYENRGEKTVNSIQKYVRAARNKQFPKNSNNNYMQEPNRILPISHLLITQ
jgi:ketopantoate hydroxymethyltransferase